MVWATEYMKLCIFDMRTAKYIMKDESMKYCCTTMKASLWDDRISLKYEPMLREYWIVGDRNVLLRNCPWCEYNLESYGLKSKYCTTVSNYLKSKKRLAIGEICGDEIWDALPEEFKTDEWWKKRGL